MEAKTFLFSMEEGKFVLKRKGFLGVVLLGLQCTACDVAVVTEAFAVSGGREFCQILPRRFEGLDYLERL